MSNNEPRDASHYCNGFSNPAGRISELEHLLEFAQNEIDGLRARVVELEELSTTQRRNNEELQRILNRGVTPYQPYILRKQAEAVEKAAKRCIPKGLPLSSILDYAQRLRQQADEIEKAGGEK